MTILTKERLTGAARGLSAKDFRPIATQGFGDGYNSYAHSMAWFQGRLYVGTTRANFCLVKLHQGICQAWDLEVWPVECPDDLEGIYALDRRAQIWCYTPETRTWRQVLQAPLVEGTDGSQVAREYGYRAMTVFQGESDVAPALYVATTSPGRAPGAMILRSQDGETFTPVLDYRDLGLAIVSSRLLVAYKGRLYTSPTATRQASPSASRPGRSNISGAPIIYASADPARGSWQQVSEPGFGDETNEGVFTLAEFQGRLYAGTLNNQGYQVWDTTGDGQWRQVVKAGAGRGPLNQIALAMMPFGDALYIGSGIQQAGYDVVNRIGPGGAELVRLNCDHTWQVVVGNRRRSSQGEPLSTYPPGFGNLLNGYFWTMAVHEGWLYLGTFNMAGLMLTWRRLGGLPARQRRLITQVGIDTILRQPGGFELWRSADGENWLPVDRGGLGNRYNIGLRTMVSTPHGLFIGTTNPFGPRLAVKQGSEWVYQDNPRGGLEVWQGLKSAP